MLDPARLADIALGAAMASAAAAGLYAWLRRQGKTRRSEPPSGVEEELRSKTEELIRVDFERMRHEEERKRAEHDLRILGKAVETMSLGVTITTTEGKIRYVNPADARLHGYTVEELIGRDSRIYAGDEQGESEVRGEDPEPWSRERINVTKTGERFPVRLVSDRVRNSLGEPIATVTICEDIRESYRIREALERRERILEAVGFAAEKFLAQTSWEESVEEVLVRLGQVTGVDCVHLEILDVADSSGRAIASWRWTGADQMASPASHMPLHPRWETLLAQGETVWGRRSELPADEQADVAARGVESFAIVPLQVGADWRGFVALESATAEREWASAEREALKTAARTLGAALQRHEDEDALARSEAKYRELLENANDLVQSIGPDGHFQFVNRAWKQALGYTSDEMAALTIWNVAKPTHQDSKRDLLQSMMGDDGLGRVEALFVAKDGREIAVEGTVTCRYVDGQAVAAQGIFRDITERRQVDRMKQEFLSTVSHELRTPLTSIIASLGLLESGRLANNPLRVAELVQVAHRNSNRLLKLINNLLDLQKLAARKMTFKSDAVDVAALFEEAIRSLQAYADSFQVELELGRVPPGARALGDRDRLIQVLHNLLSNAIKFSPPHEVVTASAVIRDQRLVLMVIDHGPGIPAEFCSRIFDQFTQADPSTTRAAGGSGLGLSIAKGLVEGMKGQIQLETREGEGTTFFVDLPLASDTALPPDAGESGTWPRHTLMR
jgi:PAS domain S-box-containing protein